MATQTTTLAEEAKIIQFIVFHVGEEEFGVPISEVREIIKAGVVTPVPDSPDFIRGLINVRGDIVATIDLRARFSLRVRRTVDSKHTIITKQQDNLFGLMVDEVTEVLRVPETLIKKAPKLVTTLHDEYVAGVLPLENRLIVLLDLGRVLSEEELARLAELNRHSRNNDDYLTEDQDEEPEQRQAPSKNGDSAATKPSRPEREHAITTEKVLT